MLQMTLDLTRSSPFGHFYSWNLKYFYSAQKKKDTLTVSMKIHKGAIFDRLKIKFLLHLFILDNNVLFFLTVLSKNKNNNPKKNFFCILSLLFHISFIQYCFPLLYLPLSHFATPIPHVLNCLFLSSLHILHLLSFPSTHYLFSLSSFLHLNLAIIFLSLALSLLRYFGISCHPPLILPVL
jgi:hypothetical protein